MQNYRLWLSCQDKNVFLMNLRDSSRITAKVNPKYKKKSMKTRCRVRTPAQTYLYKETKRNFCIWSNLWDRSIYHNLGDKPGYWKVKVVYKPDQIQMITLAADMLRNSSTNVPYENGLFCIWPFSCMFLWIAFESVLFSCADVWQVCV